MSTANSVLDHPVIPGQIQYHELLELAAHDLQSPLRKLSVLSDRLISKYSSSAPDGANEYVQRMNACIQEMQLLINGMLELGSFDGSELRLESCDLPGMLEQIQATSGSDVQVDFNINLKEPAEVQGDSRLLSLLFQKLVDNSIKFRNPELPLVISIEGRAAFAEEKQQHGLDDSKDFYLLQMNDNGIGFENSQAGKIFQPLVRLHGKSAFPGAGLGLSLCEKIVTAHNGIIYAEGTEQSGARFTIILPKRQ